MHSRFDADTTEVFRCTSSVAFVASSASHDSENHYCPFKHTDSGISRVRQHPVLCAPTFNIAYCTTWTTEGRAHARRQPTGDSSVCHATTFVLEFDYISQSSTTGEQIHHSYHFAETITICLRARGRIVYSR